MRVVAGVPHAEAATHGLPAALFGPAEINDKTGQCYGRLVVVGLADVVRRGMWREALWLCACYCRHVAAGRFPEVRCCLECAAMARRDVLAVARPSIPALRLGNTAGDPRPPTRVEVP